MLCIVFRSANIIIEKIQLLRFCVDYVLKRPPFWKGEINEKKLGIGNSRVNYQLDLCQVSSNSFKPWKARSTRHTNGSHLETARKRKQICLLLLGIPASTVQSLIEFGQPVIQWKANKTRHTNGRHFEMAK